MNEIVGSGKPKGCLLIRERHRCIRSTEELKRVMDEIETYLKDSSYEPRIDIKFTAWKKES